MKYQLVVQWHESSLIDYDKLIKIENTLIEGLSTDHDVDGHDEGPGQMNIFVRTDDPKNAFNLVQALLFKDAAWKDVRIAYREVFGNTYTILWPKGLAEFRVI